MSRTLCAALFAASALAAFVLISCAKVPEMTDDEIDALSKSAGLSLLSSTVSKPWKAQGYVPGKIGGVWRDAITGDPKTFNHLLAEADAANQSIIANTTDYMFDYDPTLKEWQARGVFYEIEEDKEKGSLILHCEVREGMVWSWNGREETVPVTSDDIVWWYNEVAGDKEFQSSGYPQQFVTMDDGSQRRIEAVKIDDRRFDFVFPRMNAEALLSVNMQFYPSFIYKKAKYEKGAEGVKELFSVASDPRDIPSCGRWHIVEYTPSQRIVFKRNERYWDKDSNGVSEPYPEEMVLQIVGDMNTDHLLFKQGKTETFSPPPESVADVVAEQGNDYTVFNAEGSLNAMLWTFNQNPKNEGENFQRWFRRKEFRQAMSCLLNRERIISQVYRGLGQPKYSFFPEPNKFYDEGITLQYRYDSEKAMALLGRIGMERGSDGIMRDSDGNKVEFDLTVPGANTSANDIAQIIADECKKVGVTVNTRQIDFQKMVESLMRSFDWQSLIISLGASIFPSQGSNVWPSSGNLHLWNPLQKEPATDWEARVDALYNDGCCETDYGKAKVIWDEYQRILLEQCPVIYLIRPRSFFAIRNKWDLSNVYYDNLNGAKTEYVFLSDGSD